MGENLENPDLPMYAEIVHTDEHETVLTVVIFGKIMTEKLTGHSHLSVARMKVNGWNQHLEKEWFNLCSSNAAIMSSFHNALLAQGVSEETLAAALGEMTNHAKS